MNLFVGSMLTLVLADNLLFLYLGWEGVGLCHFPKVLRIKMSLFQSIFSKTPAILLDLRDIWKIAQRINPKP